MAPISRIYPPPPKMDQIEGTIVQNQQKILHFQGLGGTRYYGQTIRGHGTSGHFWERQLQARRPHPTQYMREVVQFVLVASFMVVFSSKSDIFPLKCRVLECRKGPFWGSKRTYGELSSKTDKQPKCLQTRDQPTGLHLLK